MTHLHDARHEHAVAPSLFARANPFVNLVWSCDEARMCMSFGCGECGALAFRRRLAELMTPAGRHSVLAEALASLDFALLTLAPHWYDALDIALFELRSRPGGGGELEHVLRAWLDRADLPLRVLDLVMLRHARSNHPTPDLAELWVQRCLEAAAGSEDEGLVETLILSCPERVGAHPQAYQAALHAARRSACIRGVIARLPSVA
jgi:hypothetical protein